MGTSWQWLLCFFYLSIKRLLLLKALKPHKTFLEYYEIPIIKKLFWFPTLCLSRQDSVPFKARECPSIFKNGAQSEEKSWTQHSQDGSSNCIHWGWANMASFLFLWLQEPTTQRDGVKGYHPQKKAILKS